MNKYYNLYLPVYKQGDDFARCLELANGNPAKSFIELSEQYSLAAKICQTVAKTLSDLKGLDNIKVGGDTHSIFLSIPKKVAASLIKDAIPIEEE